MRKKPEVRVPDELIPAAIRMLMKYGPTAVMESSWRDPDDDRPNASRYAREIKGYRSFDPLRWSRRRHGDASAITELHVHAADRLRLTADTARLGGLPGPVWAGAAAIGPTHQYGPQAGLTAAAAAMAQAHREFRRAMAVLLPYEKEMIIAIVLENVSVSSWTRMRRVLEEQTTPRIETQKLVAALDKLVAHYDSEIREDMALGRVVA